MALTSSAGLPLKDCVAIVTGGTRGLGRGIARSLLESGATVAICGRRPPDIAIEAGGRAAEFFTCDVRKPEEARAFVDSVAAKHGRLDLLVNNAGGSPPANSATASPRFIDAILALNLTAPLILSQAAYAHMAKQEGGGSIVNIGSISGVRPSPSNVAYAMAKAGLIMMTKTLAQEWAPKVRVNVLVLGLMATETADTTYGDADAQAEIAATIPAQRFGVADDVASAIMFLTSPGAGFITGAEINIDGGGETPIFLDILRRRGAKI